MVLVVNVYFLLSGCKYEFCFIDFLVWIVFFICELLVILSLIGCGY